MLSFFDADVSSPLGCPQSSLDIIISSFLFAFFGVMMFIAAVRYEKSYDKPATWWKLCFIPLGLAVIFGLQKIAFMNNYIYRNTIISNKLLYSHWLSFLVPVLAIVLINVYKWMSKRNEGRRVY